jgi:peptide/nickel transport system permease protein
VMKAPVASSGSVPIRGVPLSPRARGGLWGDAIRRLVRNKPAMVGLVLILLFVSVAILSGVIAPYGPLDGSLANGLQPPSSTHLLGTDLQGRDEFSRVLYGARISLEVGVLAVLLALAMGVVVGAIAGGFGGLLDAILMRTTDVLLAMPGILLAIGIVAALGNGLPQLLLAIAVSYAPIFARLLRGSLLSLQATDYVLAARSVGASRARILVRHMLPNALTPLIVQATLVLATAIIDIASLGFLGLGPPDPRTPEWGTMLTDARGYLSTSPWLVFSPGLAIVISAIGFTLLGDGLRESLDPRMRR